MAEYSGISDLQFQAADNASPAGTGEDKALLTGTLQLPCGSDGPHPVLVAVRAHVFFWKEGKRLEIDPEIWKSSSTRHNGSNQTSALSTTLSPNRYLSGSR
ncbi:MAG: hypothetical protein U1U88_001877 [Lawsonella clevelandensis]